MNPEISNMIARMEHARSRLNAAMDIIAPQVEIYPTWKLKQLMDHITGWDELMLVTLRAYSKGETPGRAVKDGVDRYNAESVKARLNLPLEQSRRAYDLARDQVLQSMREMPDEMLAKRYQAPWGGMCTIASIVKIFVSHELEHAAHIEEQLKNSAENA